MTIGNQSRAMLESLLLRSLKIMWVVMEHRQIIREYRKRNQLSEADFFGKSLEDGYEGGGER